MATGYLENGEPFIDLDIPAYGQVVKLKCLIDTGFSGFLSVPLVQAFPLGLLLFGTISVTLANGQTDPKLTCLGSATLDGQTLAGLFIIHTGGTHAALGMEFLTTFKLRLAVDPIATTVELLPAAAAPVPVPPIPVPPIAPAGGAAVV